ncbi:MAG: TonB-dependent receptor [Rhodospirillaceae bacterium]|nr:MAG: TonB-dependent receptor [Rhodospirillaceae bacterium]
MSLLASAAAVSLLVALPAIAEAAEGDVETIIVTAQRRAERLQDVPITVTNISNEQLTSAGTQNLSDIAKLTPALRFDNLGVWAQPTIRGVGTELVQVGGASNVGIYVDGFYEPNPAEYDFQLINTEGIEVLKGPQGTLFGRNTTGGAILVTTTAPSKDTHAVAEASYGSYNALKFEGYGTTGLSDKVAMDVGVIYSRGDGYLKNIVDNSDTVGAYKKWSVRTGLKADLTDRFSVLLRYQHSSNNDPMGNLANAYVQNGQPLLYTANFPGVIVATKPSEVAFGPNDPQSFKAHSNAAQLTATADFDFATLTSYTQYRKDFSVAFQDLGHSSIPTVYLEEIIPNRTFTQEFLLTSKPGSRLQWTAGAFYFNNYDEINVGFGLFGAPLDFTNGGNGVTVKSYAGFYDATYQVTDQLFVTAGLRVSHDEDDKPFWNIPGPNGTQVRNYIPALKTNKVTPRVVLRYAVDSNSSVYASFTQGYKAPIYNVGGHSTVPIKAENISAYEVGYKQASQRFSFDLAAYYYDYKNLQLASYVTVGNTAFSVITNAGTSQIYGAEGHLNYEILDGFDVDAGAAYTHARYKHYVGSPTYPQCLVAACGASFGLFGVGGTSQDSSGLPMLRSPDFTATLGIRYTTELAGGKLALSSNLYYTSKIYFDSSDETSQTGYATLGLRGEWTNPSDRYTVAVYGNNVTGKRYLTQALLQTFGIGAVWGPPATFGGSVRVKF